ncbi:hypothetical protein KM043_002613 [Ampulex compressa]|nr:hypothetical protein KM043_002613 [Ampulex compressa]
MLNGACKYRGRRCTKGASRRLGRGLSGVRGVEAGRATGQEDRAAEGSWKREAGTGGWGEGTTKGCSNSPLSGVVEQEEEKVTLPARNYLVSHGSEREVGSAR